MAMYPARQVLICLGATALLCLTLLPGAQQGLHFVLRYTHSAQISGAGVSWTELRHSGGVPNSRAAGGTPDCDGCRRSLVFMKLWESVHPGKEANGLSLKLSSLAQAADSGQPPPASSSQGANPGSHHPPPSEPAVAHPARSPPKPPHQEPAHSKDEGPPETLTQNPGGIPAPPWFLRRDHRGSGDGLSSQTQSPPPPPPPLPSPPPPPPHVHPHANPPLPPPPPMLLQLPSTLPPAPPPEGGSWAPQPSLYWGTDVYTTPAPVGAPAPSPSEDPLGTTEGAGAHTGGAGSGGTQGFLADAVQGTHQKDPPTSSSADVSTERTSNRARSRLVYRGGPVMYRPIRVYLLLYGRWFSKSCGRRVFSNLIGSITDLKVVRRGQPSVSEWWKIVTRYNQSDGRHVHPMVTLSGVASDWYSSGRRLGTKGPNSVWAVLQRAIIKGHFPTDVDGAYFVLTSDDVKVGPPGGGFCRAYCGWHSVQGYRGRSLKYAFIGNGVRQCPRTTCNMHMGGKRYGKGFLTSPNMCYGPDGMASTILHELAEMATNPLFNSWETKTGVESADLCYRNYRVGVKWANTAGYNLAGTKGSKFLVQQMYNPWKDTCQLQNG